MADPFEDMFKGFFTSQDVVPIDPAKRQVIIGFLRAGRRDPGIIQKAINTFGITRATVSEISQYI